MKCGTGTNHMLILFEISINNETYRKCAIYTKIKHKL